MAEKSGENKFKAMLERRGIIRKTDAEDDSAGFGSISGLVRRSEESSKDADSGEFGTGNPFFSQPGEQPRGEGDDTPASDLGDLFGNPFEDPDVQPEPDNYTDSFLNVDDLYSILAIQPDISDSVYLIEEYLKALPDSLPAESRREIIIKIISASGFDYDRLIGDGVLRVKMLKDYAEQFARRTDEYIAGHNAELEELQRQIDRVREMIDDRKTLHKQQFFAIENEAQRLRAILSFISG